MPKRFTDTDLNRQPWFRKLKPKMKCAVRFLFDECDKAGVWLIDMETLSYFIGEEVTIEELFEKINSDKGNRIEKFGRDKIFIPGFVAFQYGELTESCKPHRPIISLLKKYGLYERVLIGYQKGIDTLEEKDKDKEKEKEEEKDFGKPENLFDASALSPKMLAVWKQKNSNYPEQPGDDLPALRKISEFICKQEGISYQPREPDVIRLVLTNWEVIASFVSDHKHFSNYNLNQVFKYRQNIVTEIKNGSSTSKNGKSNAGAKVTGAGLNAAFAKRYQQG
jgi:hypothetical protein